MDISMQIKSVSGDCRGPQACGLWVSAAEFRVLHANDLSLHVHTQPLSWCTATGDRQSPLSPALSHGLGTLIRTSPQPFTRPELPCLLSWTKNVRSWSLSHLSPFHQHQAREPMHDAG